MRMRKEIKVTGTHNSEVIFGSIMSGVIVGVFMGPVVGVAAAVAGFACGYPVAKREANKEAEELIHHDGLSDADLFEAMRNGKNMITVKTELKNIYPNQPLLGRIFIGNKLTKKTTYYLED